MPEFEGGPLRSGAQTRVVSDFAMHAISGKWFEIELIIMIIIVIVIIIIIRFVTCQMPISQILGLERRCTTPQFGLFVRSNVKQMCL